MEVIPFSGGRIHLKWDYKKECEVNKWGTPMATPITIQGGRNSVLPEGGEWPKSRDRRSEKCEP